MANRATEDIAFIRKEYYGKWKKLNKGDELSSDITDLEELEEIEELDVLEEVEPLEEDEPLAASSPAEKIDFVSGINVEAELEEAEFYLQQGLYDDASRVVRTLMECLPGLPDLQAKMDEIDQGRQAADAESESTDFVDIMSDLQDDDLLAATDFLDARLSSLSSPDGMVDRDATLDRLAFALERGERIVVFGDYDVDGTTSAAILSDVLEAFGAEVMAFAANRYEGGYGFSDAALERCLASSPALIVTCDCGSSDHPRIAEAQRRGRWRTDASVRRYCKEARLLSELGKLDPKIIAFGRTAELALPQLFANPRLVLSPGPSVTAALARCLCLRSRRRPRSSD